MKINMPVYLVHVTIENKPGISDPEGETILNDLVLKGNYGSISKIRSGKVLKFQINDKTKKSAVEKIHKLCDELRIFNPLVSKVTIEVFDK
ncbi:Phosphoribosylformylglycinamidine synthase protein [Marine Group I thaumarchaeote SCGC AAA799-O18]|nr:Phosphoribosylformylglycinamidine synthase protein [Marine Group I thaumarchaeote SCGC AAA799-O18]